MRNTANIFTVEDNVRMTFTINKDMLKSLAFLKNFDTE